jgi:hypothetical protein
MWFTNCGYCFPLHGGSIALGLILKLFYLIFSPLKSPKELPLPSNCRGKAEDFLTEISTTLIFPTMWTTYSSWNMWGPSWKDKDDMGMSLLLMAQS